MLIEMSEEDFERLVVDELDALPDDMVDGLDNVIFVGRGPPGRRPLSLFGLYDGVALTEPRQVRLRRDARSDHALPRAASGLCDDLDELRDQIHVTLVHEIAHFYGIDDDRLHELGWG